ncbi:MAG: hypothetical protein A3C03_00150 [Candidatus Colwellbacteria bacterium RIFCSPHIGHO2_02_FULL_45_17]|uniref:DNA replication/recombination mediator RecO N-terminal domain-containing protein n=2 Tax=Candidatus Colwelliibacteriota TaxID=1817904 RepID=A0A1G1ZDD2_9BACT|nr:MAG: hypothetical protein A3C03_00150 [Candidatus Colwellbacteria bacterium RIFCSPHIGHO2_02_FULL_45_17]OGY61141.1 MAG: hypothetical protein A3I33_02260 [Candidatus Colwellbacteria bacterium RIFCSPLOWO2_02_FULL_45_11]OGY62623.1 MAG: hypothetical protein A3G58_00385 [Candidatus Colwellbacteria bacterium RIFCSPLOWO2_12_FULL_46_17]
MIEYYTEGIVLSRDSRGELDRIVTIYTKELGKVAALTKSSRKITSKVSGHLMPGNAVRLRIVENKTVQAMDALSEKSKCDAKRLLPFLQFLDEVIPQGETDPELWDLITKTISECHLGPETYRQILNFLGFGADEMLCERCKKNEIAHFSLTDIMFLCRGCASILNLRPDEIVKI